MAERAIRYVGELERIPASKKSNLLVAADFFKNLKMGILNIQATTNLKDLENYII